MRTMLGRLCLASLLATAATPALAAFPVFDQRPPVLEAEGPVRQGGEESDRQSRAADAGAIVLAGGPPPWAPAHGYRKKHEARHAYDRDHHHHDDDRHVELPDLGIDRGFCNRELIGGIIVGAAGGLVGSQIGDGDTKTVATIGGTIAGVMIGGAIGRRMDGADEACMGHALTEAAAGQPVSWSAPRGERYRIVADAFFDDHWGRTCRAFRTVAFIDGRQQSRRATACRGDDGAWQIIG